MIPERRQTSVRTGTVVVVVASGVFLLGLVTRLTVRDTYSGFATLYYATPWPVLAGLIILVAGGLRIRNNSGFARPLAAVGIILLIGGFWPGRGNPATADTTGTTLSCLTWNAAHGRDGWKPVAATVRSAAADLVCLVEAGPTGPVQERFWENAFPGHGISRLGSGMLVVVRNGSVRQTRSGSLGGAGRFRQFEITCRGRGLTVVVVDLKITPWVSRRVPLEQLRTLAEELGDRPLLVTGDFNTPSDSAWFDSWRDNLSNAWTTTGQGLRATWPVPLPVLDLDQVWGNHRLRFLDCHGTWSTHSDHRPLVTRFSITARQARDQVSSRSQLHTMHPLID